MIANQLLLVTAVPIRTSGGTRSIDDQTCEGLIRWCQNFDSVVYAGIEVPKQQAEIPSSTTWRDVETLPCAKQLKVLPLPYAYKVTPFATAYSTIRRQLAEEISRSAYMCFTLGVLVGDWAGVAALEAIKQRRRYAVWFDRIEHEVIRSTLASMPLKRRVKETVLLPMTQRYHRHLIERSTLGLFQGQDCFQYYNGHARNAFCVYDTHTHVADFIDDQAIAAKCARVTSGEPLRICYVGRAAEMKAPLDWIDSLAKLKTAGVPFAATWIGDGPLLDRMRSAAVERGISMDTQFPGFVGDRQAILSAMRDSHIFLFCHKTPESPRCLIESLVSGCPIVGYTSAYARDLVTPDGGGAFVDVGDASGLADLLQGLHADRDSLSAMILAAARSGRRFDEETLYRERANLIRQHL